MKNFVDIKKVPVEEIKALRFKVLWPHLSGEEACEIQADRAEGTFHLAAYLDGKVVGTSTFIIDVNPKFEEKNQYRLRAMATDPAIRGFGVGAKIIRAAEEELRKQNVKLLWCDARLMATGFYEKLNFKIKGQVYQVPKIGPHKLMFKDL